MRLRLYVCLLIACLLSSCLQPVQAPAALTPTSPDSAVVAESTPHPTLTLQPASPDPVADPAANTPVDPVVNPAVDPTTGPVPTETPPVPDPTAVPNFNRAVYSLTATYDYPAHTLAVQQTITYTNDTGQALDQLPFIVEAARYWGSFNLAAIAQDGQALGGYTLEDNQLSVPLAHSLDPGGVTVLALDYTLVLPEIPPPADTARPQPYGFTVRQANLVDWYPFIPPYDPAAGWQAHKPGYFGEHLVLPVVDYHVRLRIYETGFPLTVAASAPPLHSEGSEYVYSLPAARSFALSISPVYQVLSASYAGTTVYSYFFTFDATGGEAALNHTLQSLQLYSELFGPYPNPTLSVVQADFLDGMEFDGLYFLSRGFYNTYDETPMNYLTAIAVHETAHQWWYGSVGNDQALQPWLDEALCTYAERLYYERYYPDLVEWWWFYRVNYYQPVGAVNSTIYDYESFRAYRDAVYLNGAHFLEALRQQIGDEAFFGFLRDYAAQFNNRQAASADFFALLAAHTDQDITPLLEQYFK